MPRRGMSRKKRKWRGGVIEAGKLGRRGILNGGGERAGRI